jgi:hypothetical protein
MRSENRRKRKAITAGKTDLMRYKNFILSVAPPPGLLLNHLLRSNQKKGY